MELIAKADLARETETLRTLTQISFIWNQLIWGCNFWLVLYRKQVWSGGALNHESNILAPIK